MRHQASQHDETKSMKCGLCDRIETKYRRRGAEKARLARWMHEGAILVASMDRSRRIINDMDREIFGLLRERAYRRSSLFGTGKPHPKYCRQKITVKSPHDTIHRDNDLKPRCK